MLRGDCCTNPEWEYQGEMKEPVGGQFWKCKNCGKEFSTANQNSFPLSKTEPQEHIDTLRSALDKCGILYVVKERGNYQYLIMVRTEVKKKELESIETAWALRASQYFFEFEDGQLVSY